VDLEGGGGDDGAINVERRSGLREFRADEYFRLIAVEFEKVLLHP